jgi:[acyl-carrier-protein] S-malonyltransferase
VVISGFEEALNEVCEQLASSGARKVVRLQVSIAAHSPLMEPIQTQFKQSILETAISDPQIAVYSNVLAKPMKNVSDVVNDLHSQLTSRVRWTESIDAMMRNGVETFIEVGSGKVLSGLIKRIARSAKTHPVNDPQSIASLISTE